MNKTISRNEFMKLTGATVLCACAGAVGLGGCTAISSVPLAPEGSYRREGDLLIISLTEVDELNTIGGAVRLAPVEGSGEKILVVRSDEDVYQAYANRCTHNGKELDYRHEKLRVECVSGKSHFDLAGRVIKGPAESALRVYTAHLETDELCLRVS